MILLGLVPILCSGLLGLAAGPLRRRLSPSVAAPLLALAALATSLATGIVLCGPAPGSRPSTGQIGRAHV